MKKYFAKVAQITSLGLLLPFAVSKAEDPSILRGRVRTGPGEGITTRGYTTDSIIDLVSTIAGWLMTLGVVLAVVFIIWGGVQYMLAGGDEEKAKKARTHIINGVIGAAVVLAAGIIVRTVLNIIGPDVV